jgi:protein SCO1
VKHLSLIERFLVCALPIAIWFAAGCQSSAEKHYPVQAEVISANPERQMITIKHGDIPGFMPGMTMSYMVADPKQIEELKPGDRITADLVVSDSVGRLEKIVLVSKGDGKPSPGSSQRLPEKGETVPNFALVNQDGKTIHLDDYRGKALLITFIYTRCPLPDFCPRLNENFRQIQTLLRKKPELLKEVAFLSISFDPENDTPAVLKRYASLYTRTRPDAQQANWRFAVPAAKDLPQIAYFFGLVYESKDQQIVHSMSTTLIAPAGKIEHFYEGNEWTPAEVEQAIEVTLHHT